MTPVSVLLDSYVRKIEQLQGELDKTLRQRDRARRQRDKCLHGWRVASDERRILEGELEEEVAEWNQKIDAL